MAQTKSPLDGGTCFSSVVCCSDSRVKIDKDSHTVCGAKLSVRLCVLRGLALEENISLDGIGGLCDNYGA